MENIILIGMKACGKSTVGCLLAEKLNFDFIELDSEIEKAHFLDRKEKLNFRKIFNKHGTDHFRSLEKKVLESIVGKKQSKKFVLSCGGGTPLDQGNQKMLKQLGKIIFLDANEDVLLPRILKHGIPAFFPFPENPKKSLKELIKKRQPIYKKIADETIPFINETPEELVIKVINLMSFPRRRESKSRDVINHVSTKRCDYRTGSPPTRG